MDNAQLINNIKRECKSKNIALGVMLEHCHLSKGFIYDVEKRKRTPSVDKVSVIADYLGVSVDYLLGREQQPQTSTVNNQINTGDNNHSTVSVSTGATTTNNNNNDSQFDETTRQLAEEFSKLKLSSKAEVITLVMQLREKEGI